MGERLEFSAEDVVTVCLAWRNVEWYAADATARTLFTSWARENLDKRAVSDAQLAGRFSAFLAGWRHGQAALAQL